MSKIDEWRAKRAEAKRLRRFVDRLLNEADGDGFGIKLVVTGSWVPNCADGSAICSWPKEVQNAFLAVVTRPEWIVKTLKQAVKDADEAAREAAIEAGREAEETLRVVRSIFNGEHSSSVDGTNSP